MSRRKLTLVALTTLVLILAAVIAGCISSTVTAPAGDIKKFSSVDEIRNYIKNNTQLAQGSNYDTNRAWSTDRGVLVSDMVVLESSAKGTVQSAALPSAVGGGSPGYSETNVQVAGVDEPDFVKNDARYIYVISGSTLTIVDAYPASTAAILSRTELEDSPREIFISDDRLVLLKTGTSAIAGSDDPVGTDVAAKMAVMPRYPYYRTAPVTHAVFYDISDRAHPKLLRDYTMDGDYVTARMIGTTVYLLSSCDNKNTGLFSMIVCLTLFQSIKRVSPIFTRSTSGPIAITFALSTPALRCDSMIIPESVSSLFFKRTTATFFFNGNSFIQLLT